MLTSYEKGVHSGASAWREEFERAAVHVQWDPERSLRDADLNINSIQVGLGTTVIERFVEGWPQEISDLTPTVRRIHSLLAKGNVDAARRLLPTEKIYSVEVKTATRLGMK